MGKLWRWQGAHINVRGVGAGFAALALIVLAGGPLLQYDGLPSLMQLVVDLWSNLGTELFSIAMTVLVIDALNARSRRDREQDLQKAQLEVEKERLILQMGSPFSEFAVEAARQLRWRGWLEDGSLRLARLAEANLQEAILLGANLKEAFLYEANLRQASLSGANLQGAILEKANLQGVNLSGVDLQGANLNSANLKGAYLLKADLQEARLFEADLQEALLWDTKLGGARLDRANLQAASLGRGDYFHSQTRWACYLLRQAESLRGATLPDGTVLPNDYDDSWREAFEVWCEGQEGG